MTDAFLEPTTRRWQDQYDARVEVEDFVRTHPKLFTGWPSHTLFDPDGDGPRMRAVRHRLPPASDRLSTYTLFATITGVVVGLRDKARKAYRKTIEEQI